MFDKKKAQKKLRAFVENQTFTIAQKADMMVSHFHEQVIAKGQDRRSGARHDHHQQH